MANAHASGFQEGWSGPVGLMLARLGFLIGLMLILAILLPGDSVAFYSFMALAYIISIPYALWSRNSRRLSQLLPLQFIVDLVVVTGVVYFTGGISSELALLYPLIILSAGIMTTPRHAIEITVLSSVVYVTLVILITQGVLVRYGPVSIYADRLAVIRATGLRVVVFICFGVASAYVSQRCQFLDRNMSRFREMAEIMLKNVRAGLMLLDSKGVILTVNDRACALLDKTKEELVGKPVDSLVAEGSMKATKEGDEKESPCYLQKPDGTRFPVSVEMSKLEMPAEIIPGLHGRKGLMEVCITVFSDISRIMAMREQIERAERVKTAVDLAAEIAHEIRNPLAAVSGAAQQLDQLEKKALLGDKASAEVLLEERRRIYEIIVTESARLDRTIERFIDYTEYSPEAIEVRLDKQNGTSKGA